MVGIRSRPGIGEELRYFGCFGLNLFTNYPDQKLNKNTLKMSIFYVIHFNFYSIHFETNLISILEINYMLFCLTRKLLVKLQNQCRKSEI